MRRVVMVVVVVVAAVVSACGGGDTDELVEAGESLVEAAEAQADAAQEQAEAAQSGLEASGAQAGFSSERCQEIGDRFQEAQSAIGGDGELEATAELFLDLADEVPEGLSDDFQLYGEFLADMAVAQQSGDAAAIAQAAAEIGNTQLATAAANVASFFAQGCQGPQ